MYSGLWLVGFSQFNDIFNHVAGILSSLVEFGRIAVQVGKVATQVLGMGGRSGCQCRSASAISIEKMSARNSSLAYDLEYIPAAMPSVKV